MGGKRLQSILLFGTDEESYGEVMSAEHQPSSNDLKKKEKKKESVDLKCFKMYT